MFLKLSRYTNLQLSDNERWYGGVLSRFIVRQAAYWGVARIRNIFCHSSGTIIPIAGQRIVSLSGKDRRPSCTLATWRIRKPLTILSMPISICIST